MNESNNKSNIELSLSSISWQLKRIADSLEIITDELSSDESTGIKPSKNPVVSSKLRELINNQ